MALYNSAAQARFSPIADLTFDEVCYVGAGSSGRGQAAAGGAVGGAGIGVMIAQGAKKGAKAGGAKGAAAGAVIGGLVGAAAYMLAS